MHWDTGDRCWHVQRKGWPLRRCYATELEAAYLASGLFNIPVEDLRLKVQVREAEPEPEAKRYRFLHWHRRDQLWTVQRRSGGILRTYGRAATQLAVAHLASRAMNIPLEDLKLAAESQKDF